MPLTDVNLSEVGRSIQLIGAIYADADQAYAVILPDEHADRPLRPVLLDQEEWEAFLRQSDLVEFEATVQAKDGTLKRAIVRKASRQINQRTSFAVYRRDQWSCRYCGRCDVPLTVDHLVTWESGGPSIEANLVSSCSPCNRARGEMPYEEWLESPYYARARQGLTPAVLLANRALVTTLDAIPRTPLKEGKKRKR